MNGIGSLREYSRPDMEKMRLIDNALSSATLLENKLGDYCLKESPAFYSKIDINTKYCPKCGQEYPSRENVCLDCLVHLKNIEDKVDVRTVEISPEITFDGAGDIEDVLGEESISKINEFRFSIADFRDIVHKIKLQAFKNFDEAVKDNDIDYDILDIRDKILLFTKSFVRVEYKSYGGLLGYFESDTIYVDDRQTKSLQITTLLHELSHFLIKEILVGVICRLLDTRKNQYVDDLAQFVLSASPFVKLIDEYAAHNVEGRFTIFGYQDYSSFRQIEAKLKGEMEADEIEITKSIGNNFAITIKDILESLIDDGLREEIKDQFLKDVLDRPNYEALRMENCDILTDEGYMKAIWLILTEGIKAAAEEKNER